MKIQRKKMKKTFIGALPCIATVAFATFVGKKTLESSAYESNSLLMQNVETLAQNEGGVYEYPDGYPSICNVLIGKSKRCKVEVIICQGGGSGCNSKKCPVHPE